MADEDQLNWLRKGVAAWNAWRMENPLIRPDLSRAYLVKANLTGADLSKADLRNVNLGMANLIRARLNEGDLRGAMLSKASLVATKLRNVSMTLRQSAFRFKLG
jgi:uncharacterized protein YjbI with pentapeptide repeats